MIVDSSSIQIPVQEAIATMTTTTDTNTATIAPAGTWAADPVHSNVSFEIGYAGVNTFRGSFTEFEASLTGDALEGAARVASVDVKDEQLNGHLQTPDFFDAARYPEIEFRATELTRVGDDPVEGGAIEGKGELTIKGVTQPVTITGAIAGAPATDPFGRERLGLRLETTIDRTQYGVSWNAPNQSGGDYLANDVKLLAELALVRQEG
jgi:polyisoprenoid-binding protein YceI